MSGEEIAYPCENARSKKILLSLSFIALQGKTAARLVAENAESYGWGNLTLAVQLLLPLAVIALIFTRKRIWIYPYPLLDTYISVLCPSFSQQQRLLKWMSSRIPHMNSLPNKITQYWQNGSLLCTLINTVVPGACPNPQKHWKKPPTHGQALAYKYLGVAPILTENDFKKQTLTSYWERKFIKYLLSIQEAISKVTVEEDALKFTSKYVARGMGLVIGEQNHPTSFYIYPNTGSNKIENILINIKGPYNTFGGKMISCNEQCLTVKNLDKIRMEDIREENRLAYQSKAQRSFFKSVSFDIGPIMNLMSNKKNAGEILVKVEMENDRAKVTFVPKFSGIYELLLTNDGQHLQGSPFIIRITKNNKEVEDILQENARSTKSKIERRIISKSIDFISESISVTDDLCLKLDPNNNTNVNEVKELSESNKSDDESSTYQDSGVFDFSDHCSNRSRQTDLEEIDEDSRFSEISDVNTTDDSKSNSLDYKLANDKLDIENNIGKIIELENKETQIIVHKDIPHDVKFLTKQYEKDSLMVNLETTEKRTLSDKTCDEEIVEDGLVNGVNDVNSDDDIFDSEDLQNNQDFENLYNKYAVNDDQESLENICTENTKDFKGNNSDEEQVIELHDKVPETGSKEISEASRLPEISTQNINTTDFEVLKNIPQFQKGRRITSSVEKIMEIFENDSPKQNQKNDVFLSVVEKKIIQKSDFTNASPVLSNIAQEAADASDKIPVEDSVHLKGDAELSSRERHPVLTKDYSICIDDDEIFDTNVKEIKTIFEEAKPESKPPVRKYANTWRRQDNLQESKKKLAKSLPNLHDNIKDSLDDLHMEDEFLARFKEKRNFWNNLIMQNSNSNLNVSPPDVTPNSVKLMSKQYQNVSQSTNSLISIPKSNKVPVENKFTRRKEELYKTTSLDLTNSFDEDVNSSGRSNKITRAKSLYDRIRVFDKDFDSGKYNTLLKKTKERSNLKDKVSDPIIVKPESLTEVPNTTSNNQIQEDIHFADIMKERFEISRRYFCSLESLTIKPNLYRRHSMDSKTINTKEVPLHKGGSLKVLNVLDRFSMDNVYRDVVLSKLKNCSFKGRPNKEAVVETLSSISSVENEDMDKGKDKVEEDDLNMQFFNIKKRLRKRRSIKSIFDVNY